MWNGLGSNKKLTHKSNSNIELSVIIQFLMQMLRVWNIFLEMSNI